MLLSVYLINNLWDVLVCSNCKIPPSWRVYLFLIFVIVFISIAVHVFVFVMVVIYLAYKTVVYIYYKYVFSSLLSLA